MQKNALCPDSAFQSCLHNGHMVHCVIGLSFGNSSFHSKCTKSLDRGQHIGRNVARLEAEEERYQSMVEEGHSAKPPNADTDLYSGGGASRVFVRKAAAINQKHLDRPVRITNGPEKSLLRNDNGDPRLAFHVHVRDLPRRARRTPRPPRTSHQSVSRCNSCVKEDVNNPSPTTLA